MSNVYNYKSLALEVKDVDKEKGIVVGYFSAFGNVDSDGDIIHPGSFTKTISENGPESTRPRIKHLLNHNPSQPLGVLTSLKEDSYGLRYESKIGSHQLGKDFVKMVESGLVSEHSIGFRDLTPADKKNGDGFKNITEVKLYEGSSLTGWGANEMTPLVGMKGASVDLIAERIKQIEKFCKSTDASDECIDALLIQIKQLQQIISELTTPAEQSQEPERKDLDIAEQIRLLIHI